MYVHKLKPAVLGAVRQHLGAKDEKDPSHDADIAMMGELEVFRLYLEWNGIIGYANQIWSAMENIKAAHKK